MRPLTPREQDLRERAGRVFFENSYHLHAYTWDELPEVARERWRGPAWPIFKAGIVAGLREAASAVGGVAELVNERGTGHIPEEAAKQSICYAAGLLLEQRAREVESGK